MLIFYDFLFRCDEDEKRHIRPVALVLGSFEVLAEIGLVGTLLKMLL